MQTVPFMNQRIQTKRVLLGLVLLLVAGGAFWLVTANNWPGGFRSGYQPKAYDKQLTEFAKTALPVIAELTRARATSKSNQFPTSAAELVALSDGRLALAGRGVNDWSYEPSPDGATFFLSRKLGWDPKLVFRFDGKHGSWVLEPGDGSPEKLVLLKP